VRVLVLESDRDLGAFLKKGLENDGHSVEWLENAEEVLAASAQQQSDLIVLDLGVGDRDGTELLAGLKAANCAASLLVLTGQDDLQSRIRCFDMGADDCLLKPFSFLEFTARCRALLRRRAQIADQVLRCGAIELHRVNHQVHCGGRKVELTTKEFALLEYLMLHRGESVSRAELLANVWKLEGESATNIVDVYINYLRRKLEGEAARGSLIQTVRGTGYRVGGSQPGTVRKSRVALRTAFASASPAPLAVNPC